MINRYCSWAEVMNMKTKPLDMIDVKAAFSGNELNVPFVEMDLQASFSLPSMLEIDTNGKKKKINDLRIFLYLNFFFVYHTKSSA